MYVIESTTSSVNLTTSNCIYKRKALARCGLAASGWAIVWCIWARSVRHPKSCRRRRIPPSWSSSPSSSPPIQLFIEFHRVAFDIHWHVNNHHTWAVCARRVHASDVIIWWMTDQTLCIITGESRTQKKTIFNEHKRQYYLYPTTAPRHST